MRIHGEKLLKRRTNIKRKKLHSSYKIELVEDFQNTCGYCGKDFSLVKCNHQIDHLIPEEAYKKYGNENEKNEYSNLVYSCRVCNRNKWDKWPFDNVNQQNNGKIGFVDPASDEYDVHLCRNELGKIEYITPLGEYMYTCFGFGKRRTEVVWKLMRIQEEINKLKNTIDTLEGDQRTTSLELFYKLNKKFDEIGCIAKSENEIL